jgi:undecaprenyl-diphosphatase
VAWIRNTAEPPERRPTDIAWLVVGIIGTAVVGVWAQSQSSLQVSFFLPINDLTNDIDGAMKAVFALGSIWAALAVTVVLLAFRQLQVAWRVAVSAAIAWGVGKLLIEILPAHVIKGLTIHVRVGDGPAFPSVNVAVITALVVALAPYIVRSLRRLSLVLVFLVAFAAMYLGTAYPSDVLGGFLLGIASGMLVLVVFGSPAGRPTIPEVREFGWKVIVNGGSSGYAFDGDATASWALVTLDEIITFS